jgi:NTE family protein
MKKFGLALGSSGSRGSYYIGFLKALEEEGLKPSYISGSSMGSIVGGCYCNGMSVDTMIQEMTELKFSQLIDVSLLPMRNLAILRSNKLIKKLDEYFGGLRFSDMKIPFSCVAVDLHAGELKVFGGKDEVAEGIAASSTIPGIFKAYPKDDMLLVDGAIKCRVPVRLVREMGADVIVAVDVLGRVRPERKRYNFVSLLLRTYDVMDAELARHKASDEQPDLELHPDLGDMVRYKFKGMQMAFEQGYKIGKENAEEIRKLLK